MRASGTAECNTTVIPGVRLSANAASCVIRILSSTKLDGRKVMASRAFMRGTGFNGHFHAIQHEVSLLESAAADKLAQAARLRDKLQRTTENTTVRLFSDRQVRLFSDHQVLISKLFIYKVPSQEETAPQPPSPADSLHKQLADVSQQSFKKSSEECLPSPSPSVEATDRSAPALRFHEGGISSSHLETVPAPTEHGLDSARSSFPRESEPSAGKGASVTQRSSSPIGREPATPASVSPITSPVGSQRGRASSRSI